MPDSIEGKAIASSSNSATQDVEELSKILSELSTTIKDSRLYSLEHPRFLETNTRLLTILQEQLEKSGNIVLKFIDNQVVFHKIPLRDKEAGAMSEVLQACLDRQIQSITFSAGLSIDELAQFVRIVTMSPEELRSRGGMQRELLSCHISHITIESLVDSNDVEEQAAPSAKAMLYPENQLGIARSIIRSLQEELEMAKTQVELLWEKNKELGRISITDELTGLYNQKYFYDRLEQEVIRNRRQKHPLCLLFFDVDNLKTYNDTYGHLGGNDVLKAVARGLSQSIRKDVDSGYRYGGDEFAAILPETPAEQAVEVARRINRALQESGFQHVTLSFGIAELGPKMDGQMLFKHADDAMYMAKQGRSTKIKANTDKVYIWR